jgi:hypothetical protein
MIPMFNTHAGMYEHIFSFVKDTHFPAGDGDFEYRSLRMMMRIGFLRVCGCSGENTCPYEFFARVLPGSALLSRVRKPT